MATSSQFTVDGTSVKLGSSNGSPVQFTINAAADIWIGGSSAVTTSTGYYLKKDVPVTITLADNQEIWAIHDGLVATTAYVFKAVV